MRFRNRAIFLAAILIVLACCRCGPAKNKTNAVQTPPQQAAEAKTPQLLAVPANTGNVPPPPVTEIPAYSVAIDHALLFDPRMGPINGDLSDESGVHLLVSGRIRNDTGRLLHRAKVYATIVANFGERTQIERHSGGLGFSPRVNSTDPWRPDTERTFLSITRPLDPIYLELPPEKIMASLTLTTQDPLSYRFRGEIHQFPVIWDPVLGTVKDQTAVVALSGAGRCAPQTRSCDLTQDEKVQLLYQRGAAYKVVGPDGTFYWVAYDQLAGNISDEPAAENAKPAEFPIRVDLPGKIALEVMKVAEYTSHSAVPVEGKIYVVDVRATNLGEKPARCPDEKYFSLDLSAGAYAAPYLFKKKVQGAYQPTLLKPGQSVTGSLFFAQTESEWLFPFDLELHPPKEKPTRWPLFPTLLAAQKNQQP